MQWGSFFDIVGAIFVLMGCSMSLFGAIGLVRFPNFFVRMHAAAKPQTLGLFLILIGLALSLRTWGSFGTLLLVGIAQALTAPVSSHMLNRATYRAGVVHHTEFDIDELHEALERARKDPEPEPEPEHPDLNAAGRTHVTGRTDERG